MPSEWINDPEEWERLTGSRGSVYIGARPARRAKKASLWLCPSCYEVMTRPRPGIVYCETCDKQWDRN
jgi:hypothetical protein